MNLLELARSAVPDQAVETARHWRVRFPSLAPVEVIFTPEASRAEVAKLYPGAELEMLPEPSPRDATASDAAEPQPDPLPDRDDRRTCEQCANLDRHRGRDGFRRCAAARRGELSAIAQRDYSPVPDQPMRCEGFTPGPDDHDRRRGRERWPGLTDAATVEPRRQDAGTRREQP